MAASGTAYSGDPPLKAARVEMRKGGLTASRSAEAAGTADTSALSPTMKGTESHSDAHVDDKVTKNGTSLKTARAPNGDIFLFGTKADAAAQAVLLNTIDDLEAVLKGTKNRLGNVVTRAAAIYDLRISLAKNHTPGALTVSQPAFDSIVLPVLVSAIEEYIQRCEDVLAAAGEPEPTRPHLKRRRPCGLPAATAHSLHSKTQVKVAADASSSDGTPLRQASAEEEIFNALWCLINISAGDSHMTKIVLKHGVVALMVRLLKCTASPEVIENAIWICGNISGDGAHGRDELFRAQVLELLVGLVVAELQAIGYYPFIDKDSAIVSPELLEGVAAGGDALADVAATASSHSSSSGSSSKVDPAADTEPPAARCSSSEQPGHCILCDTSRSVPWYTSNVLQIATWALLSMCEGQPRPPLPLEILLPVFSACLDCPDVEVQSHVCWALSHICDGPPEHMLALLCSMRCLKTPNVIKALHMLPTSSPGDFCMEAVGVWTPYHYSPAEDIAIAAQTMPAPTPDALYKYQCGATMYSIVSDYSAMCTPEDLVKRVKTRFEANILMMPSIAAKLIRMLRQNVTRLSKPAMRALGNIVCAEDERDFTQAVVNMGLVPLLRSLMDHRWDGYCTMCVTSICTAFKDVSIMQRPGATEGSLLDNEQCCCRHGSANTSCHGLRLHTHCTVAMYRQICRRGSAHRSVLGSFECYQLRK